jgi:hypothetical protein
MRSQTNTSDGTAEIPNRGQNNSSLPFTANLILFALWLRSIPLTSTTGWRYRQRGWISTVNLCGRVFVTKDEIARFERRAIAGEFSKVHKTPKRKTEGQ